MVSKKTKLTALFMLIATVLCAVIAAIAGAFGIGANVQTASADAAGTSYNLGTNGSFTANVLTQLMGKIMGKSTASYNELKIYMDKQNNKQKTGGSISANVTLGGMQWNVVFASENTSGEVIATLWSANAVVSSQSWNKFTGTASGYSCQMYSTSYIRSLIVGSRYIDSASATNFTTGSQNATFKTFITSYGGYIDTPHQVEWQYYQSEKNMHNIQESFNSGLYGTGNGWDILNTDFTNMSSYSDWGNDKLWLPSLYETGITTNTTSGLWGLSVNYRTSSGWSWARSAPASLADCAWYLHADGYQDCIGVTSAVIGSDNYVSSIRPAFHLNLKKAAVKCGLFLDKPATTELTKAFSTAQGTVTVPSVTNMTVTKPSSPTNWTVSGTTATIPANTPVGSYTIGYTPAAGYSWSDGSVGAVNVSVRITPATISSITWSNTAASVAYTGAPVNITATGGGVNLPVTVSGDNMNVGSFTVRAFCPENYVFASSLTPTKTYTITKKAISVSWDISNNSQIAYDGANHKPTATFTSADGMPVTLPVTLQKNGAATTAATAAGSYVATVAAGTYCTNYNLATAATVNFTITKAQITANDVEWSFLEGAKFATGAQPQITALYRFNGKAYQLATSITATSGSTTDWTAGDYTATATLPATGMENFALTGTATRNFLLSETANGNYTVIWEGFSPVATYNGANQTPTAYIISDGEKLAATVTVEKWDGTAWTAATSAKDAGEYRFTATRTNYALSNDKVECRIDPRVISVDYSNLTGLIHGAVDGNNDPVKVTATTGDPVAKAEIEKGELNLAVTGGSNLAGTHLVSVAAQVKDGSDWTACANYVISNATAVQTVNKKVLTDNDITWTPNGLNFTYDGNIKIPAGTVKTAALTGGDTGSVYVIFEFVYAVEVGSYQVKVLGLSNDNYAYSGFKTVTIVADGSQSVQWEGVQNGGSVRYNGGNQLPKPYIVIGGEKVYLEIDSLTRDGADVSDKTAAIIAGEYVAKVNEVTSGNYQFGEATVTFTIAPMELKAIYLTQNVFIYSGSNPVIEVYALGANNEKIVIYNRTVTVDGASASLTDYSDAGNYAVTVASGVLSSNSNYTFASSLTTTFAVNPMTVEVTFITAGNNWIWQDGKNSEITVTASVPNSVKVNYGNFGAVNADVADNGSGTFVIAANSMTSLNGKGMISVTTVNGNYQISGQSFRTFDIVSSETTATAEFEFDGKAWTDDNVKLTYGDSRAIAVSGSDGVEVKYYKDGVLLTAPVTDTAGLDAGNYLITVSCATREVKTNINDLSRSFIILPKEVDLSSANWVINGNTVAGNSVAYNGQIYSATLDLGDNADGFAVYYTNGASKNVGSVTTRATVVPKNGNYKAVGVADSYNWTITDVAATVSWNSDGTVASISGDNASATGGSFFVKEGASYKVVYKKDGVVLDKAPTADGDYTAEVVLALGNDGNVKVTANSFSFTISGGSGIGGGDSPVSGGISWWWIALIVIASLALFFAIVAVIIAMKKKAPVAGDDDGFYDDVTDEDLM